MNFSDILGFNFSGENPGSNPGEENKSLTLEQKYKCIDDSKASVLIDQFNLNLIEFITVLSQAVDESIKLKIGLELAKEMATEEPKELVKKWVEAVHTVTHLIKEDFTDDLDKKFIEIAPTLPYIKELELEKYWDEFEFDSKTELWKRIYGLTNFSHLIYTMPVGIWDSVERIGKSLVEREAEEEDKEKFEANLFDNVVDSLLSDKTILEHSGFNEVTDENKKLIRNIAGSMIGGFNGFNAGENAKQ